MQFMLTTSHPAYLEGWEGGLYEYNAEIQACMDCIACLRPEMTIVLLKCTSMRYEKCVNTSHFMSQMFALALIYIP